MLRSIAHQFLHFTGSNNVSGTWYGFWSGFGGDLTYLGIVYAMYRKHNCEITGCWRISRHHTVSGHNVCHRHNPAGNVTIETVKQTLAAVVAPTQTPKIRLPKFRRNKNAGE